MDLPLVYFLIKSIKCLLILLKNVSGSIRGAPSILYLLHSPPKAPSMSLTYGFQFNLVFRASLLAIRHSLFLLFFTLLIFLFISAILTSMRLDLFGGCSLRGAPRIGSLGTHCSINSSLASDFDSFSAILLASLFILLIFFLLNPALNLGCSHYLIF